MVDANDYIAEASVFTKSVHLLKHGVSERGKVELQYHPVLSHGFDIRCPGDVKGVCAISVWRKRMCHEPQELPDWSIEFKGPGHQYRWHISPVSTQICSKLRKKLLIKFRTV